MKLTRRQFGTFTATAALLASASPLFAQSFPSKEITLLVNYGAGGAVDRTARAIQPFLPEALGQNVIVENIGGAGGKTGLKKFMEAERDGYTILTAFAPATTYAKFTDPDIFSLSDLAIINVMWTDPAILLAQKDAGWTSLADMIAYAKANPGKVTFGSSGKGGAARKAFASGEIQLTAAGAGGATSIKDDAVVLGLFSDAGTAPDWPDAPSINAELAAMNVSVPEGGAYRFFAVHSDVKKNHPERFETLVKAFEETINNNQAFKDAAAKSGVGTDWQGAEAAQSLIEEVDARFTKILQDEADG